MKEFIMTSKGDVGEIRDRLAENAMSFSAGFLMPMSRTDEATEIKYMDWQRLKKHIEDVLPNEVYVGLEKDWSCTSEIVYSGGTYGKERMPGMYASSNWDTPVAVLVFDSGEVIFKCYTTDEPEGFDPCVPFCGVFKEGNENG